MGEAEARHLDPEHYGERSYAHKMLSRLKQLQENSTFCDITIVIGHRQFAAHRAVLISSCSYFRSMFTAGFQESHTAEVEIQGSPESFAHLLEFAYTGYFYLSPANVCGILRMACYMDYIDAIKACTRYIRSRFEHIDIGDVFEIYCLAETHHALAVLVDILRLHILQRFAKLAHTDCFLENASREFIITCLSSPDIETETSKEEEILSGVLAWLHHDWDRRKRHTVALLKKVRLGLVPIDTCRLQQLFYDDKHVATIPECEEMIEEVMILHANRKSAKEPLNQSHPDMFATRNTITVPVYMKEEGSGIKFHIRQRNQRCYSINRMEKFPGICPTIPEVAYDFGHGYSLLVTGGQLYLAGGMDEPNLDEAGDYLELPPALRGFFQFDPERNIWMTRPDMLASHCYPVLVELDGYIYAIGSSSGGHHTYEAERYNISSGCWQKITPLLYDLNISSGVAYNGYVFVAGSHYISISSWMIECILAYNPNKNSWTSVYERRLSFEEVRTLAGHYPVVEIMVHDGTMFFQSTNYSNGRCVVKKVVLDCKGEIPKAFMGKEVDQVKTFGALLEEEDVVRPYQLLTFDKRKLGLSTDPLSCNDGPYGAHKKKYPFYSNDLVTLMWS